MECSNCGYIESDEEKVCSNCGAEFTKNKRPYGKLIFPIILIFVTIALIITLTSGKKNNTTTSSLLSSTTTAYIESEYKYDDTYQYEEYLTDELTSTMLVESTVIEKTEKETISNKAYLNPNPLLLFLDGDSEKWCHSVFLCDVDNIYAECEWKIGNSKIATIEKNGNQGVTVYSKSEGETVLYCTCAGKSFSCKVKVYPSYAKYYGYDDEEDENYSSDEEGWQDDTTNNDNSELAERYKREIENLEEEIRIKERKKSILQMDTSGINAGEIAKLNREIDSMRKDLEELYKKYYKALGY